MASLKNFFKKDYDSLVDDSVLEASTHFYNNDYNTVVNVISRYATNNNYVLKSVDNKYREVFIESAKFSIIFSLNVESQYVTLVDIKVVSNQMLALNKPMKLTIEIFEYLNHNLYLKSKGRSNV